MTTVRFDVISPNSRRTMEATITPEMRETRPGYAALLEMCDGGEVYVQGAHKWPDSREVIPVLMPERKGKK